MANRPEPALEQCLLQTFDSLLSGERVRLLLLGDASTALASELRGRASTLTHVPDMDRVTDEGVFDAAVVVGRIERERWDRWELQRLHARLAPGAPVVLAAPNLASLWTLTGLSFIGSRLLRELRIRLARRSGSQLSETGPFRGRRYRASSLRTLFTRLGFEIVSFEAVGNALYRLAASMSPRLARDTSGTHVVGARRSPSLWAAEGPCAFPERQSHALGFEAANAPSIRVRDAWASGHRPLAGPPAAALEVGAYSGRAVLVLAPHPDDEVIGCGGTLRRLIEAGAHVTILHATDGSDSAALSDAPESVRTSVRLEEAARVAESLGAHEVLFWKCDNRCFRVTAERIEDLTQTLARLAPRIVFVPFVTDIHPDHFVLSRMLGAALPKSGLDLEAVEVFNYEVWSLVPAAVVCDVTEYMPLIERLLLLYETALKVDDYVHLCADRMYYNAGRYLDRPGYAEAFVKLPASEYLSILQEQEREPLRPA